MDLAFKSLTIRFEAIEQYFHVVGFILLYKLVLALTSADVPFAIEHLTKQIFPSFFLNFKFVNHGKMVKSYIPPFTNLSQHKPSF